MSQLKYLITFSILLRFGFFFFGLYQDEYMPVKYTDIDYLVFNDASKFVYQGLSPYLRETYRYTPILAILLIPDNFGKYWYHFGKLLFMVSDVITGLIILKLLSKQQQLSEKKKMILVQ